MKRSLGIFRLSVVFAACVAVPPVAQGEDGAVVIQNGEVRAERVGEFSGVINLREVREAAEGRGPSSGGDVTVAGELIMDQDGLEALFEGWLLGDPPEVDFTKQVVTVATWGGSRIDMLRWIDGEANLEVRLAGGSKDLVMVGAGDRGATYQIEVYTLSNIRSVNGQEWPAPGGEAGRSDPAKP